MKAKQKKQKKNTMKMKWSLQDMARAVKAVREDKVPLQRAATKFKVPRNTLRYRIDNDIPIKELKHIQRGPITALSRNSEEHLANFIVYLEKHGFMLHRKVINDFAWLMAKKEGTHVKFNGAMGPGKQWWSGFRQRHPEVSVWKPRKCLPLTQANVTMKNKLKRHFKALDRVLEENGIKDDRRRIFNCGESGVEVDIASRQPGYHDTRQGPGAENVETKEHISIQLCVTASGESLPPMLIYKGKKSPKGRAIQGGPVGALYATSKTGFLNSELYLLWFKKIFLKHITDRPVVLIQEGTSCHMTPEIVECAQQNKVALYCIPMGTSRILQPLEVSVMEPLKEQLKKAVTDLHEFKNSPGPVITRLNFAWVFREPFDNAMSKHTIKKGFKKTGLCPWDPDRIAIEARKSDIIEVDPGTEVEINEQTPVAQLAVMVSEVPEPIRGQDDEIIEMVVNDEDSNEVIIIDQIIDMGISTSGQLEPVQILEDEEAHSISSDDLDEILAEEDEEEELLNERRGLSDDELVIISQ
ncbi:uncharacterized protein LOC117290831 [Asterias rubens]|uniref:uncharacterized protein LOC117290831 n=1 Tax=Asterias rubens TaxID=7604 RepID=UPI001455791F|nr:uncharacterized protein LOC117290831 [Asterias rubens]